MPATRAKKKGRPLLKAAAVLLVLLLVGLFFLPMIVGKVATAQLDRDLGDGSRLHADRVKVRWLGPTTVDGLTITTRDGDTTLDLDVSASTGVLAFLTDWMNVGEVTVSGEVTLPPVAASGNGADQGSEPGSSTPLTLPAGLRGTVKADGLTLVVPDQNGSAPADVVVDGVVAFAPGKTTKFDLRADAQRGALPMGSVTLAGAVDGLISRNGRVRTDDLAGGADLVVDRLATALFAPFLPPTVDASALFGDQVGLKASFDGSPAKGTLTLALDTPNLTLKTALALADGVATSTDPATLHASAEAVAGGYARLAELLANAGITLDEAPDVTLTAPSFALRLPTEGKPFDLRTLSTDATLALTPAALTVAPEGAAPRTVRTQAGDVRLVFDGPNGAATLVGGVNASVEGQPATSATVDLAFADLLDNAGGVRTESLSWPVGSVRLASVPAALLQPFLGDAPVRLVEDFGPTIDAAVSRDDASSESVHATLDAEHARLDATAVRTGDVVSFGRDTRVELDRPGPLMTRAAGGSVRLEPERAVARFETLEIDTSKLGGPVSRWLRTKGSVDLGTTRLGSPDLEPAALRNTRLVFSVLAGRSDARLQADGGSVGGEPAVGAVSVLADLTHLLDGSGAGRATVTVESFTPAFVRAWTDASQAADALAAFAGPVRIEATPRFETADGFSVSGPITVTGPGGSLEADGLYAGDGSRLALTLVLADGRTLAPVLGVEDADTLAGAVRLEANGELHGSLAEANAVGGFKLSGSGAGVSIEAEGGATKGQMGGKATVRTTRVDVLAAVLGMDEAAVREALGDEPTLEAELNTAQSPELLGETGTGTLAVRGGSTSLDARLTLTADTLRVRTNADVQDTALLDPFVAALPTGAIKAALGQTLRTDADVTLARVGATGFDTDRFAVNATVRSPLLHTNGPVVLERDTRGFRLGQAVDASWTVTPELIALLAPAPAEGGPAPIVLLSPTRVELHASVLDVPADPDAKPTAQVALTGGDIPLRLRGTLERTYTGLRATASADGGTLRIAAGLSEGEREVLTADLAATAPSEATGNRPELTGSVKLTELDATVLDAFASGEGAVAEFLGAWVSADVELDRFPGAAGTVTFDATSPNADVTYAGKIDKAALVATKPFKATVRRITQDFGFRVAKFIPVAGGVRKSPDTNEPATFEAGTLVVPLDRDINKIELAARIDIGTGDVSFDQDFIKLIDKRIVEKGRSIGDSFEPFNVTMKDGVFKTEELTIPIGEFEIPTTLVRDYPRDLETKRYKIPGGALAAEALKLAGTGAGAVKGLAMIEVKFSGPIDGDKPEMDVKFTWDKDTLLKDGAGEGIKEILRRLRGD